MWLSRDYFGQTKKERQKERLSDLEKKLEELYEVLGYDYYESVPKKIK